MPRSVHAGVGPRSRFLRFLLRFLRFLRDSWHILLFQLAVLLVGYAPIVLRNSHTFPKVFQWLVSAVPSGFLQILQTPLAWLWVNLVGLWCTTGYFFVRAELAAAGPKLQPNSPEARFQQYAAAFMVAAMIVASILISPIESIFTVSLHGLIVATSMLASVSASVMIAPIIYALRRRSSMHPAYAVLVGDPDQGG